MATRRALHFVFKVGNRFQTVHFFRDVLGMQVLRHEEFEEGCKAACNGPYDGKWSKTMVGFGPEDDHFVAELTYNYGIGDYKLGNDFMGITLASSQAVSNARKLEWPLSKVAEGIFETEAPGGYKFYLQDRSPSQSDPVLKVTLAVSDLQKSLNYWSNLLGMKIYEQDEEKQRALLGYADNQCKLELQGIQGAVDHAAAFGRIAFSCPQKELPDLEDLMKRESHSILTPLVSLDTPGKATVQVVILADPDGHEICFVGDEAFRELSKMDPKGSKLLDDIKLMSIEGSCSAKDSVVAQSLVFHQRPGSLASCATNHQATVCCSPALLQWKQTKVTSGLLRGINQRLRVSGRHMKSTYISSPVCYQSGTYVLRNAPTTWLCPA